MNQAVDTIVFVLTILGLPVTLGLAYFVFWGYKFLQENQSKPTDPITVPDGDVIQIPHEADGREIQAGSMGQRPKSQPRVD